MAESKIPESFIYPLVADQTQADGVAWVFTESTSPLVQYPFKFPDLDVGDVRAKIVHTGLCASDHLHSRGKWHDHMNYPVCPGHEVVAIVTAVGSGVTNFKVGDVVGAGPQRDYCNNTCSKCKKGQTNLCEENWTGLYDPFFGGYATHIQLPAKMTFKIPDGMPLDRIPPLLCAGVTVYAPISRWAKRNPPAEGVKTAVIGIGGLGHMAVQYLNKLGYHVTAFSTNVNRAEEYKKLGASETVHSTDAAALEKVYGKYDYVISTTFFNENDTLKRHIKLVRKSGTFTMVALPDKGLVNKIDIADFLIGQISFEGSIIGSYQETSEMLEFSKKHECYPIVENYAFEDFNKALDKLENGRPQFRCVVNVTDWAKKNGFDK